MNMMDLYGFRRFFSITVLLLTSVSLCSTAQNNNLSLQGKVVDARTSLALPGATVHINGTTHEVVTDRNGEFRFVTGQKPPFVLHVTYIGYQTKDQEVTSDGHIVVSLSESSSQLNDVVVVGYGTQTRKNLIGSIAKVNAEEA